MKSAHLFALLLLLMLLLLLLLTTVISKGRSPRDDALSSIPAFRTSPEVYRRRESPYLWQLIFVGRLFSLSFPPSLIDSSGKCRIVEGRLYSFFSGGWRGIRRSFSSFPFADQVSEVERLPRSGGLSGHLIHAGMPNDFLFITRKGNGIYRKKPL